VAGRSAALIEKKPLGVLLFIILGYQAFTGLKAWPDYLSYFNELAGGPDNGYKYLRDSNIDWGEDLPALRDYLSEKEIGTVRLDYFGSASPDFYGIKYEKPAPSEAQKPEKAVYAISVHNLEDMEWTRTAKPAAKLRGSIYVYDLRPGN
jgi:hypothetical protein